MKPFVLLTIFTSILIISLIFFGCTKTYNCTCAAKSPNQTDLNYLIKDPSKMNAQKKCDAYEKDSMNNLEYDCTLK